MTVRHESGGAAARGAADWLSLAAAPTFAVMALLTGLLGSTPDMLCAPAHGASSLGGMVPMYLLMSAFHSAPWLKLLSRRREESRRQAGVLSSSMIPESGNRFSEKIMLKQKARAVLRLNQER